MWRSWLNICLNLHVQRVLRQCVLKSQYIRLSTPIYYEVSFEDLAPGIALTKKQMVQALCRVRTLYHSWNISATEPSYHASSHTYESPPIVPRIMLYSYLHPFSVWPAHIFRTLTYTYLSTTTVLFASVGLRVSGSHWSIEIACEIAYYLRSPFYRSSIYRSPIWDRRD